jgi:hypothetical protein
LNFNDLFFIPSVRFLSVGTALGFYGCGTRLSVQLHTEGFSCQLLFQERKNLQEIHFKPPDQARRPTFASDKTKPGLTGNEAGETL